MQGGAEEWTPETPASLRAGWTPDGKLTSAPAIMGNGDTMATWADVTGNYTLDTLGSVAPTGVASTTPVVAGFNGTSQSIGTGAVAGFPTDAACTIGMLVRSPSNTLSARNFDTALCFSHLTTTNQQILFCLLRPATTLYFGVATMNSGAGVSYWYGDTAMAIDTWYDVVYTMSGSALTVSVNGVAQSMTQVLIGPTVGKFLDTISCNSVSIGGRHWPSAAYAEWWAGRIDQAWWYSTVLGASDLTKLQTHLATRRALLA